MDERFKIKLANKAFLSKHLAIKVSYITDMTKFFNSGVESVDFENSTGTSNFVNNYVTNATDGLINKIVEPEDFIDKTIINK